MAYRDDLAALGFDHHFPLEANSTDLIGAVAGTDTSITYGGAAIAEDAANSAVMNGTGDRIELPSTSTIQAGAHFRKIVGGWFLTTAIQPPPCRIYGEGSVPSFHFVLGYGNNVMFEAGDGGGLVQVFADRPLLPNRAYHLVGVYEGSGFGNLVKFYLDGVVQELSEPADGQPDDLAVDTRANAQFGDPSGSSNVGLGAITLVAPANQGESRYNHWAFGVDLTLTDAQVRDEMFEKGALPTVTIASDTETSMQTALDALASTVRPDAPLCIRVEDVTGSGDLTLTADNVTFDPLASIHVQWMGTGTLTWINDNGGDAAIASTPNGGTVVFEKPVDLTITVLDIDTLAPIEGARVLLRDSGLTVLTNSLTNASGQVTIGGYGFVADEPVTGRVRKGSASPYYVQGDIAATITTDGLDVTVLLVRDE